MNDLKWFFIMLAVAAVSVSAGYSYVEHEEQVCKSAAMAANKSADDALMLCSREDYMYIHREKSK